MDSRSAILFTILAVLSIALPGAWGLRCYQCTSRDPACADPIDKRLLPRDCNANSVRDVSRWITDLAPSGLIDTFKDVFGVPYNNPADGAMQCQKVDIFVNSQNYTVRGCALVLESADEHCRRVVAASTQSLRTAFCGVCTADGCNAASGLVGSLLLSLALPAALVAFLSSRA